MRAHLLGWALVALQALLLATVVLLPPAEDWPTPGWVDTAGLACVVVGLAVAAAAALRLGSALTPTPVPTRAGELRTAGPYGLVRHPIYTGLLVAVAGVTLRSGSVATLAVALATLVFFHLKARWEETHLAERYPGYRDYARATPRFVPRWRRPQRDRGS